jgi:hypothetical protein
MQGANRLGCKPPIGQVRGRTGVISQHSHHGIEHWINGIDAGEMRVHHLRRTDLTTRNVLSEFSRR